MESAEHVGIRCSSTSSTHTDTHTHTQTRTHTHTHRHAHTHSLIMATAADGCPPDRRGWVEFVENASGPRTEPPAGTASLTPAPRHHGVRLLGPHKHLPRLGMDSSFPYTYYPTVQEVTSNFQNNLDVLFISTSTTEGQNI